MANIEMSPQARSSWVVLEWFYKTFGQAPGDPTPEFGVAVSIFNLDTREFRRNAVRMAWPPSAKRMATARSALWSWIAEVEQDAAIAGGAVEDEVLEGREIRGAESS